MFTMKSKIPSQGVKESKRFIGNGVVPKKN